MNIEVDPDELTQAATRIHNVLDDTDGKALDGVAPDGNSYGHDGLAGRTADFVATAKSAVELLTTNSTSVGDTLRIAADVYRERENQAHDELIKYAEAVA